MLLTCWSDGLTELSQYFTLARSSTTITPTCGYGTKRSPPPPGDLVSRCNDPNNDPSRTSIGIFEWSSWTFHAQGTYAQTQSAQILAKKYLTSFLNGLWRVSVKSVIAWYIHVKLKTPKNGLVGIESGVFLFNPLHAAVADLRWDFFLIEKFSQRRGWIDVLRY